MSVEINFSITSAAAIIRSSEAQKGKRGKSVKEIYLLAKQLLPRRATHQSAITGSLSLSLAVEYRDPKKYICLWFRKKPNICEISQGRQLANPLPFGQSRNYSATILRTSDKPLCASLYSSKWFCCKMVHLVNGQNFISVSLHCRLTKLSFRCECAHLPLTTKLEPRLGNWPT